MFFQDPYLNKITCMDAFPYKTYCFQEIEILKQQNAKSVKDASIWVKFIPKNSNTLEIEHSLLNSLIIIPRYGFHLRSTDLADNPHTSQFVNKLRNFSYQKYLWILMWINFFLYKYQFMGMLKTVS